MAQTRVPDEQSPIEVTAPDSAAKVDSAVETAGVGGDVDAGGDVEAARNQEKPGSVASNAPSLDETVDSDVTDRSAATTVLAGSSGPETTTDPDATAVAAAGTGLRSVDQTALVDPDRIAEAQPTAMLAVPDEGTTRLPVPDEGTVKLPTPAQRSRTLPSGADMARWSGRTGAAPTIRPAPRAPVPAPQPQPAAAPGPQPGPESPQRLAQPDSSLALPVTAGLAALLLFAVLGVGIWLILHALGEERHPSVNPASPPPSASSAAPVVSDEPPSEPPSSFEVTRTTASMTTVPSVFGKPQATATQLLSAAGLRVSVVFRDGGSAAAGTALGTDPPGGSSVLPNTVVTLVIARSPSPSASSPSPSASSPSPSASGTQ
jgi:hypothetical protein